MVAVGVGVGVWLLASDGSQQAAKPSDDPVQFLRGVVRQIASNDFGGAWEKLHPTQQRVATREDYVNCEQLTPAPGHVDWIKFLGRKEERITVAGEKGTVPSEAVKFRLKLFEPVLQKSDFWKFTVHAVAVDGQWRWILPPAVYEKYRTRACFQSPPVPDQ